MPDKTRIRRRVASFRPQRTAFPGIRGRSRIPRLIRWSAAVGVGLLAADLIATTPAAAATTLAITTISLPTGEVGGAYGIQLEASGGHGPYSWSTSTALPEGLALGLRGPLTGTPSVVFDAPITVTVTNALGLQASATLNLDIAPALVIAPIPLPGPIVGTAYSTELQASGGIAPYSWSISSGALPLGLVLSSSGTLSGIPGALTPTTTTFTVTDALGYRSSAALTISVGAPAAPPASYYLVRRDGAVSAHASPGVDVAQTDEGDPANVVAIATDAAGDRYWTATSTGQVIPALDTPFYGSVGKKHLLGTIVGMAALTAGGGYYVVSSTGHVYGFGATHSLGSVERSRLSGHIVGIALNATGTGYWLASSTGHVYAFGTAHVLHERDRPLVTKSVDVATSIVGIAPDPGASGYWLVARTGRVFTFGNAPLEGSVPASLHLRSIVAIAPVPSGAGYWVVNGAGMTFPFGTASPLLAIEVGAGTNVVGIASAS